MSVDQSVPSTLQHPSLGSLQGILLPHGLTQFRNLPYAEIPGRWQHSRIRQNLLSDSADGSVYDATKWGPMAPQTEGSIAFDNVLIQMELPLGHDLVCSEEKCINLVVTCPSTSEKGLPVMVFIHGGGFVVGSNAWPQYDLKSLVRLSETLGTPVIGVGINYRLGLLGFLASERLQSTGNFGLCDQAVALRWIQTHIAGFGGDPNRVTVLGESAGAISTWFHLLRGEKLFSKAICMSGDPRLRPLQPVEASELVLTRLLTELDLHPDADELCVSALENVSWKTLVSSPLNLRVFPSLTEGFVNLCQESSAAAAQSLGHFKWCQSLLLSDCAQDASAFVRTLTQPDWRVKFERAFSEFFSDTEVEAIKKIVGFYHMEAETDVVHAGLLQFVSNVRFYMPIIAARSSAPSDVDLQLYHFHEPNPFQGPFNGMASHVLDIAYALQNYENYLSSSSAALAREMGLKLVSFANGKIDKRGESIGSMKDQVVVWGLEGGTQQMSALEYDSTHRSNAAVTIGRLGHMRCVQGLELFQFGRR